MWNIYSQLINTCISQKLPFLYICVLNVFVHSSQSASSAQGLEEGSVVVKVHYVYTVALSVPVDMPYAKLKEEIAQKVGQPTSQLRLR